MAARTPIFDAHLDLAYLGENGRDMSLALRECGGPHVPAAVTFPELRTGGVAACLGTIFTEAGGTDTVGYPVGDAEAAHAAGVRQLERYRRWEREGLMRLSPDRAALAQATDGPLHVGILMECADPIRTPDEVPWWAAQGVLAIGMAWARGSRYATGNSPESFGGGAGLTDLGRALVPEIDGAGLVHDASHLSDRAFAELAALSGGRIIASHSNCRTFLANGSDERLPFRHLTDEQVREIVRRGGVIGLVIYSRFLRADLGEHGRASIDDAMPHLDRICEIAGHRRAVGLGSDMDGGFCAERLPRGIDSAADLPRLLDALSARGWPDSDIHAFAWGNWASFWSASAAGASSARDARSPGSEPASPASRP
jgi:membrane dipeptidase